MQAFGPDAPVACAAAAARFLVDGRRCDGGPSNAATRSSAALLLGFPLCTDHLTPGDLEQEMDERLNFPQRLETGRATFVFVDFDICTTSGGGGSSGGMSRGSRAGDGGGSPSSGANGGGARRSGSGAAGRATRAARTRRLRQLTEQQQQQQQQQQQPGVQPARRRPLPRLDRQSLARAALVQISAVVAKEGSPLQRESDLIDPQVRGVQGGG
jgi:hypothetical protein